MLAYVKAVHSASVKMSPPQRMNDEESQPDSVLRAVAEEETEEILRQSMLKYNPQDNTLDDIPDPVVN